ncbi:DNA (cytosine-5)-methyltransferase 1 [Pseudomonas sp. NFPP07]|uniref:DNA cytosine methyltransferase n=1 Tax=Pseudomonas sp. NFPP07 TaxID=1566213 RepID=UPI0008E92647|nr:DNA cytosine methyltransferase [Pseudomonas sp. NFPP07]SFP92947.1 DNA (cytosine-5)-methyltransferase 1 [Pseudomonas sp. NFPP07]
MNELALFAGAGGGILGGHLLGWRTVCAVERDAYAAQVLAQRQNDGAFPPFPIWSDVCSFNGRPWRGLVDVVSGGFPCQDISVAGNGDGIDGARSGLWREMARIVGEVRPRFVYVENSPLLVGRGLALVLGDLAEMGYDAEWCIVSASDCGAPHQRERCWAVAHDNGTWQSQPTRQQQERRLGSERSSQAMADTCQARLQTPREEPNGKDWQQIRRVPAPGRRWPIEPGVGRMADGVAFRLDRIKALGNGQVPRVAATAFTILSE